MFYLCTNPKSAIYRNFGEIESSGIETDSDETIKNVQNIMLEYQNSSITLKENEYIAKLPWEPPPLPKDRVKDTIPFCTTGIDFTGPLHINYDYYDEREAQRQTQREYSLT